MLRYGEHKQVLLYLAGIGFLCLLGCENGEIKDQETGGGGPAPVPVSTVAPAPDVQYYNVDDYTYSLKGTDAPHSYLLTVMWPKANTLISISINKTEVKKILPTEINSFAYLVPDQTKIHLQILNEKHESLKEWIFDTPKDFVFNSTEIISQNTEVKANRIFFKNKSFIETASFNFTVEADEFFFEDGAKMINYQNPPKTIPQKDGEAGGNIQIVGKKAYGKLNIELSGGDGGKGMTAFPYFPPAPDGKDGKFGLCTSGAMVPVCTVPTTDGEPSPSGYKGKPGFTGNKGGKSGALIVEITDQSEVEIIHTEKPGSGGEGGDGGMGQLKGKPGKGIIRDESCLCDSAKEGEDSGRNGETGEQGIAGANGDVGTICISIGRGAGVCKK